LVVLDYDKCGILITSWQTARCHNLKVHSGNFHRYENTKILHVWSGFHMNEVETSRVECHEIYSEQSEW